MRDFPGGPVVKNPPSNAGDSGSIPGRGTKIPSPRATTTELPRPGAREQQLKRSLGATATEDPACLNEDPACCK